MTLSGVSSLSGGSMMRKARFLSQNAAASARTDGSGMLGMAMMLKIWTLSSEPSGWNTSMKSDGAKVVPVTAVALKGKGSACGCGNDGAAEPASTVAKLEFWRRVTM